MYLYKICQGFKIKTFPAMIWGTKESLRLFFKNKGINNAISFFEQKTRDKRLEYIYVLIRKH